MQYYTTNLDITKEYQIEYYALINLNLDESKFNSFEQISKQQNDTCNTFRVDMADKSMNANVQQVSSSYIQNYCILKFKFNSYSSGNISFNYRINDDVIQLNSIYINNVDIIDHTTTSVIIITILIAFLMLTTLFQQRKQVEKKAVKSAIILDDDNGENQIDLQYLWQMQQEFQTEQERLMQKEDKLKKYYVTSSTLTNLEFQCQFENVQYVISQLEDVDYIESYFISDQYKEKRFDKYEVYNCLYAQFPILNIQIHYKQKYSQLPLVNIQTIIQNASQMEENKQFYVKPDLDIQYVKNTLKKELEIRQSKEQFRVDWHSNILIEIKNELSMYMDVKTKGIPENIEIFKQLYDQLKTKQLINPNVEFEEGLKEATTSHPIIQPQFEEMFTPKILTIKQNHNFDADENTKKLSELLSAINNKQQANTETQSERKIFSTCPIDYDGVMDDGMKLLGDTGTQNSATMSLLQSKQQSGTISLDQSGLCTPKNQQDVQQISVEELNETGQQMNNINRSSMLQMNGLESNDRASQPKLPNQNNELLLEAKIPTLDENMRKYSMPVLNLLHSINQQQMLNNSNNKNSNSDMEQNKAFDNNQHLNQFKNYQFTNEIDKNAYQQLCNEDNKDEDDVTYAENSSDHDVPLYDRITQQMETKKEDSLGDIYKMKNIITNEGQQNLQLNMENFNISCGDSLLGSISNITQNQVNLNFDQQLQLPVFGNQPNSQQDTDLQSQDVLQLPTFVVVDNNQQLDLQLPVFDNNQNTDQLTFVQTDLIPQLNFATEQIQQTQPEQQCELQLPIFDNADTQNDNLILPVFDNVQNDLQQNINQFSSVPLYIEQDNIQTDSIQNNEQLPTFEANWQQDSETKDSSHHKQEYTTDFQLPEFSNELNQLQQNINEEQPFDLQFDLNEQTVLQNDKVQNELPVFYLQTDINQLNNEQNIDKPTLNADDQNLLNSEDNQLQLVLPIFSLDAAVENKVEQLDINTLQVSEPQTNNNNEPVLQDQDAQLQLPVLDNTNQQPELQDNQNNTLIVKDQIQFQPEKDTMEQLNRLSEQVEKIQRKQYGSLGLMDMKDNILPILDEQQNFDNLHTPTIDQLLQMGNQQTFAALHSYSSSDFQEQQKQNQQLNPEPNLITQLLEQQNSLPKQDSDNVSASNTTQNKQDFLQPEDTASTLINNLQSMMTTQKQKIPKMPKINTIPILLGDQDSQKLSVFTSGGASYKQVSEVHIPVFETMQKLGQEHQQLQQQISEVQEMQKRFLESLSRRSMYQECAHIESTRSLTQCDSFAKSFAIYGERFRLEMALYVSSQIYTVNPDNIFNIHQYDIYITNQNFDQESSKISYKVQISKNLMYLLQLDTQQIKWLDALNNLPGKDLYSHQRLQVISWVFYISYFTFLQEFSTLEQLIEFTEENKSLHGEWLLKISTLDKMEDVFDALSYQ